MMSTPTDRMIRYERDGDVALITLDRSPVNAYDSAFHVEFQEAWRTAKTDDSRVVLMRATGKHFCVGANMKDPAPAPPGAEELSAADEIRLVRSVTKPTIAAVQGGCIGGGQRLVWPCDLVLCTDDAFFMDPTADMGIGGIQSHLHTWFYGPRLAKQMIYSGARLSAARLYAMGQVNEVYPDLETLHTEALALAHQIATKDPGPLRQAKRAVDTTMDIMGQHYVLNRMEELLDPPMEPMTMRMPTDRNRQ
jgi:enoyl-CoA hydratase/carnithine racemase